MNVNHIIIIILIVIILFMIFTPRSMDYTFYPRRRCKRGEMGCDPNTWTPKYHDSRNSYKGDIHRDKRRGHTHRDNKWQREHRDNKWQRET